MDLEIKILLVEDNLEDAAVTKRVLKHNKLNNGLVIATSGKEALAALQNKTKADLPQLILLDINLPDISGIDLLTCIKKDENLQQHTRGHSYRIQCGSRYSEELRSGSGQLPGQAHLQ